MRTADILAYLGGMVDGDGYLKITKSPPRRPGGNAYYGISVGIQQLMPGEAVRLFAATFEGKIRPPTSLPGHRPILRCEVHSRKAEAAMRRLAPYLIVKRSQALLLLEVAGLRRRRDVDMQGYFQRLEALRQGLRLLHEVSGEDSSPLLSELAWISGYDRLGPPELGWTREQVYAYLAGTMDSDGSFRVEKRRVRGMLHPHYRINLRCAQVAPSPAVELLKDTFGGNLSLREDKRPNARTLATWSIHDRGAVPAIKAMLPYLIVKKLEAWLLLELRCRKREGKRGTTEWTHANRWHAQVRMRKRCYTEGQTAEFERIYRDVLRLHSGAQAEPGIDAPTASAARGTEV